MAGQHGHGRAPYDSLKAKLGLSDKQIKQIETIKVGIEKEMEKHKYELKSERLAMKELAIKGKLTKSKIKEGLGKTHGIMEKMHKAKHKGLLKVVDVLTDDQVNKLAEQRMLGKFLGFGDKGHMMKKHHKKMKHKKSM
jgi:hypothetical protein